MTMTIERPDWSAPSTDLVVTTPNEGEPFGLPSEEVQNYRTLVADGLFTEDEVQRMFGVDLRAPTGGADFDPKLLQEWEKSGGIEVCLKTARDTATAVMDALDAGEAQTLQESFDRLPQAAQSAIYSFLAVDGSASRPATEADVAKFSSTEEGAALLTAWGKNAARNVGRIRTRVDCMMKRIGNGDREQVEKWIDAMSASQFKAVMNALSR